MGNGPTVLIYNEDHGKTGIQEFPFALGSGLLYCVENLLERDDGYYGRFYFEATPATENRSRYGEGHFLPGAYDLWSTDNQSTPVHMCEHFTHPLINLVQLDNVWLESPVELTVHGP